ncbi:isoprenylcysteine carboxylmethyltransferase family protein [bacterium]|nr:isoprenylcysteine carboxylmethyltransferase family protein [bacterium]
MPFFPLFAALVLFASAGTLDWMPGRWCIRAVGVSWLSTVLFLAMTRPDLLRRRSRKGENTAEWDGPIMTLFRLSILLLLAVAGLQSGRGGFALDSRLFATGALVLLLGNLLLWSCLHSNPFFETEVRHQRDQSQTVIQTGPYALVRHPGYVALILLLGSLPWMLHSSVAVLPWLLCVATLVTRLLREEAHLSNYLPGYRDYQERCPFRLIPWVW